MKIEIDDNKIFIVDGNKDAPYVIMKKPEVDDYSNITTRPLVVNYHLMKETIWERSCSFMNELQSICGESPYLACYSLLFKQLYPVFLSSSQAKIIFSYGIDEKDQISKRFHSFMTFLQESSSFIVLPEKPFVFSALLNKSCHAAVVSLDICMDLTIICDIISKIRRGGKLFLFTIRDDVPNEMAELIDRALKSSFGSNVVYSITVDDDISLFACENNSESGLMPSVGILLNMFEELKKLTAIIERNTECLLEVYPTAVELLWKMEKQLIILYDALENPELPILTNLFREALMDCYIGEVGQFDKRTYFDRMWRKAQTFYEKMETEFGQMQFSM